MSSTGRGIFLTLEGIEGAGKSSQLETIRVALEKAGKKTVTTREPGGSELAEAIRGLLLDPRHRVGIEEELLLMFAARASHISETILPALNSGHWVICDRFTDASYAYQGGGRGIPDTTIAVLEDFVQKTLRPDHCLLFDLPVKTGLQRARGRGPQDRFEQEEAAFFERIRASYLARAKSHSARYSLIDASMPLEKVSDQVRGVIQTLLASFNA